MQFNTLEDCERFIDEFLWPDKDEKQRLKRERILEAATTLFVQYGYRKTSIDEVARAAGIAKGTLYLYYSNKAELVFHAVALEKRAYLSRLVPLLSSNTDAIVRLRSFIALGLTLSQEMPLVARVTGGDREIELAIRDLDTSVLARINEWQSEFMVSLLGEAAGDQWPESVLVARARILGDMIYAVATSVRLLSSSLELAEYARAVADIMVQGALQAPDDEAIFVGLGASEQPAEFVVNGAFA